MSTYRRSNIGAFNVDTGALLVEGGGGGVSGLTATGAQLNAAAAAVQNANAPGGAAILDAAGNWARLAANLDAWNAGSPVGVAGAPPSEWVYGQGSLPNSIAAQSTPFTLINPAYAIRQDCAITGITIFVYYVDAGSAGATWKFKLFRWDGANYQCVAEAPFTFSGSGVVNAVKTATFSVPIPARLGDIPGLYMPLKTGVNAASDNNNRSYIPPLIQANDVVVGSGAAFGPVSGYLSGYVPLNVVAGPPPYAVWLGDSVLSDGNGGSFPNDKWYSDNTDANTNHTPGGSPGDKNYSVAARVAARMPANFRYQNLSRSGATLNNWTGFLLTRAMAVNPKVVFIHLGYNDLFLVNKDPAADWATWFAAKLDLIRAGIGTTRAVYLDEVLPTVGQDDASVTKIRTLNANYAAYCAANGWTLVKVHDAMGVGRATTGYLDDLNPIYASNSGGTADTVHLSLAGADRLAEIQASYLLDKPPSMPPVPLALAPTALGLTAEMSGQTIYAVNTSSQTFTLPACQSGLEYEIIVATVPSSGSGHTLQAGLLDNIVGSDVSGTATVGGFVRNTQATSVAGDRIRIKGGPNRHWYITGIRGTWSRS